MIDSPCIQVCQMDEDSALCIGCFRTLDEIAAWGRASDAAKIAILASVEQRRQELDPWGGELRSDCDRI